MSKTANLKPDIDPRQKEIGLRIRDRREYLRLSQQQVANRLNIKRETYSHYETGYSSVSAVILERIAKVLRCSISYLYGTEAEIFEEEDYEVQAAFINLAPEIREGIRAMIMASQKRIEREETTHAPKAE